MKRICLVGTGPKSRGDAPYDDPTVEIWTIGRGRDIPPRVDRLFELHAEPLWDGWGDRKAQVLYRDALKAWDKCPLYMQEAFEEFPAARKFPKDEILKVVTLYECGAEDYQTSQVSWQLAYAIYEIFNPTESAKFYETRVPYGEISLYGYDLVSEGESRSHQRHAVEYYIGMARGMGINVVIADKSTMCKYRREDKPVLYGYDYPLTRDEAVWVYGHPMRRVIKDKDGNPVSVRDIPGVMAAPYIDDKGETKLKVVRKNG